MKKKTLPYLTSLKLINQQKKKVFIKQHNGQHFLYNQKSYNYDFLENKEQTIYNNKINENEFNLKKSKISDFWRYRRKSIKSSSNLFDSTTTANLNLKNELNQLTNFKNFNLINQTLFKKYWNKITNYYLIKKINFFNICKYLSIFLIILFLILTHTLFIQKQNEKILQLENRVHIFEIKLNVIKNYINIVFDDNITIKKQVKIY